MTDEQAGRKETQCKTDPFSIVTKFSVSSFNHAVRGSDMKALSIIALTAVHPFETSGAEDDTMKCSPLAWTLCGAAFTLNEDLFKVQCNDTIQS